MTNLDELLFSFVVMALVAAVGKMGRQRVKNLTNLNSFQKRLLYEAISTAEAATFFLEMNYIIWDNYPLWVFMGALFGYCLYSAGPMKDFEEPIQGNPSDTLRSLLQQNISLQHASLVVIAQTIGACVPYLILVKPIWMNAERLLFKRNGTCLHSNVIRRSKWPSSMLQDGPQLSFLSESLVTILLYLVRATIRTLDLSSYREGYANVVATTLIYCIGAPYSGAYYNPAIATGVELFLTTGSKLTAQMAVYWLAPLFGGALALYVERFIAEPKRSDNLLAPHLQ